jgi:nucleoside-diphosphate-sugar epimerase
VNGRNPTILITGASGFVGRHLLDELKNEYRIIAIARRSQHECNAPVHPNIAWIRVDITDKTHIAKAFREAMSAGGVDYLFHLAAFYEFSGDPLPQYRTTNVEGTRNILQLARTMNLKLFVFASSVAACSFPAENEYINELSPADGEHIYAWSKRQGEQMIKEFSESVPCCIVRFGAVYSDWCEYPPLYMFLNTWLGKSWRSRILAGKGNSAIPYIHVRDIVAFFRQLLLNRHRLGTAETLVACTRGSTSHLDLYNLATRYFFGKGRRSILMPKTVCGLGLYSMNVMGKLIASPPFERPWMWTYIDKRLNVENIKTCQLIGWTPNQRYLIERRIPYMVERFKSEPFAWQMRNMAALRRATSRPDFNIYTALSDAGDTIIDNLFESISTDEEISHYSHLRVVDKTDLSWFLKLVFRLILTSIHTSNKLLLQNYFEISGYNRFQLGYSYEEIVYLLKHLNVSIQNYLNKIGELKPFRGEFYYFISLPIEFAIDEMEQQYQLFLQGETVKPIQPLSELTGHDKTAREQLEETIWNCLVQRK